MLEQTIGNLTVGQLISYGLMAYGAYLILAGVLSLAAYIIVMKYMFR